MSSTWREPEAVHRIIRVHSSVLRNSVIKVYSDYKNVKSVLFHGSNKPTVNKVAVDLHSVCMQENIIISPEMIP